jgi:hypothetical protein
MLGGICGGGGGLPGSGNVMPAGGGKPRWCVDIVGVKLAGSVLVRAESFITILGENRESVGGDLKSCVTREPKSVCEG